MVQLLEPVARAVQHAHRQGVIHRDIKPANILLAIGGDSVMHYNVSLPERRPRGGAEGSTFTGFLQSIHGDPSLPRAALPPLAACTPKLTDFGLAQLLGVDSISQKPGTTVGTPFYMWPYYMEEYPHLVTLTKLFYLAEIPVTQEMFEAVMHSNPSTARDPRLPVQDPSFREIDRFCEILSRMNGRTVRLPTDAEWEYAARVGTSNPGFPSKYASQNSTGTEGSKVPLPVKSMQPNAWGLYDMASCWWEITADRGMYNVRHPEVDPRYPPQGADPAKLQRSGRGFLKENWSIGTHEFILEKGYAGQKFRVLVEDELPASPP